MNCRFIKKLKLTITSLRFLNMLYSLQANLVLFLCILQFPQILNKILIFIYFMTLFQFPFYVNELLNFSFLFKNWIKTVFQNLSVSYFFYFQRQLLICSYHWFAWSNYAGLHMFWYKPTLYILSNFGTMYPKIKFIFTGYPYILLYRIWVFFKNYDL